MRRRVNGTPPGTVDGIAYTNHQQPEAIQEAAAWKDSRVLLGCLAFRLLNALLVQTYFNPDEHWQSAEVAHRIVFGYGHLTWEWKSGLRSYVHPLIFAALYKVLVIFKWDTRWLVMKAPRLVQAVFATFGDYYLFKLAELHWGEHVARWALFCQLLNWFTFFCMVRPFSNCLEAVLTVAALYYWPTGKRIPVNTSFLTARQLALFLAALACAIRPTSAIVWLYVAIYDLFQTDHKLQLLTEAFLIGSFVLGATCLVDRWMYLRWIFVPLNFLKFNFFAAGGDYYGTHPWHWYFSQGFPAMIFSFLPLLVAGMWWSKQWRLAGLMGWVLSLYSILGHKEFRFVLPILPLAMMFAGYGLATMELSCANQVYKSAYMALQSSSSKSSVHRISQQANVKHQAKNLLFLATIVGLLATNVPTALYMSLVHQRGSESVMHYLSSEVVKGHVKSVMFLMPCHSTPFYSFLHVNIPMRFLDCSPSDQIGYVDEADRFLSEPGTFLSEIKDSGGLPTHFVLFDSLEDRVLSFFSRNGYKQEKKLFHSHFAVDRGLQGFVLVYTLNGI